jgi:hypothetical protein
MIHALVLAALLVGTGMSSAAAQTPPRPVVDAALRHLITKEIARGARLVIAVDRFPEPDEVRRVSGGLGVRAGPTAELVECNDEVKKCRLWEGNRLIRLRAVHRVGNQWAMQIMVSTQAELPRGGTRLFSQLRNVVIGRTNGAWKVDSDQVIAQS